MVSEWNTYDKLPEAEIYHTMHPANPPPHDFARLRRGLALAWLHLTDHAFAEIVAWCGSNHLPYELVSQVLRCTRTFLVHDRRIFKHIHQVICMVRLVGGLALEGGIGFGLCGMDVIH